ncbi:hypothetical protein BJ165DRAFT_1402733 [Panaeolus papilionaceus]|nr:hypothetical protein BJ165DRAFT_1402733 [Panaeolus papilionaceus]
MAIATNRVNCIVRERWAFIKSDLVNSLELDSAEKVETQGSGFAFLHCADLGFISAVLVQGDLLGQGQLDIDEYPIRMLSNVQSIETSDLECKMDSPAYSAIRGHGGRHSVEVRPLFMNELEGHSVNPNPTSVQCQSLEKGAMTHYDDSEELLLPSKFSFTTLGSSGKRIGQKF